MARNSAALPSARGTAEAPNEALTEETPPLWFVVAAPKRRSWIWRVAKAAKKAVGAVDRAVDRALQGLEKYLGNGEEMKKTVA